MTPVSLSKLQHISCMIVLFIVASSFSSAILAMTHSCDPDYVSVDENGWFVVSASADMTGVTDTDNLNCTTNAIENGSFEKVRLKNGNFHISEVVLNCPPSKNCLLSGTTKGGTVVNIVDGSIECEAQWVNRYATSGITVLGSATVRYMTLNAHKPCALPGSFLPSMIQFTGARAVSDTPVLQETTCANATSFAILDRVDISSTGDQVDSGLWVGPQSLFFNDTCQYLLTGTFNGVRNSIDGPFACAAISMQGRARAGLDFFVARNCPFGAVIYNAGQTFRMTRADILVDATTTDDDVAGVLAFRDEFGPETSSVSIDRSTIEVRSGPNDMNAAEAVGVFGEDILEPVVFRASTTGETVKRAGNYPTIADGTITNIDFSVTNTNFILDGGNTTVARFINLDNGTFSANDMSGNGLAGVEVLVPLVEVVMTQEDGPSNIEVAVENSRAIGWSFFTNEGFFFPLQHDQGKLGKNSTKISQDPGMESYTVIFDHFFTGAGTENNTIGLHEGATVTDWGCNFNLNVPDGGCALNPMPLLQHGDDSLMASSTRSLHARNDFKVSARSFWPVRRAFREAGSGHRQ